jgi:hypothetical protein
MCYSRRVSRNNNIALSCKLTVDKKGNIRHDSVIETNSAIRNMFYVIYSNKLGKSVGRTCCASEAARINRTNTHQAITEDEYLILRKSVRS